MCLRFTTKRELNQSFILTLQLINEPLMQMAKVPASRTFRFGGVGCYNGQEQRLFNVFHFILKHVKIP